VFYGPDSDEIRPRKPRWRRKREAFIKGIRSADAARAAGGLLIWAEGKRLRLDYGPKKKDRAKTVGIKTPGGDWLFRIKEQRVVRMSFQALRHHHWDEERISRLVKDLAKIDERFATDTKNRSARPEAPLEALAQDSKREDFLALMEQALETLAS